MDKKVLSNGRMDGPSKLPYPKSVFFIISNEFCERFSYYGMKAILILYFRNVLLYTENTATLAFHVFAMSCYFTPVLGAIIADSLLGKFWTILTISIVYASGNVFLSFAAIKGTAFVSFIGLAFIAFGTGGIKPCVSAFGGDQFAPEQKQELVRFFSLFYVSINAGGLLSTFFTPVLRQVSCMDRSDCYPLAFGVPAILMITAVMFFIAGRFITTYKITPLQKENLVVTVCKCVCHALSVKFFNSTPKRSHWLEYAEDRYDLKTINEVKALMGILFLYLPLPIFWSLFDQQGSRWTLQAIRMNGKFGSWTIKPDQIQVINPVLVVFMIPIFEYVIYPFLAKVKTFYRPLQRMTIGGVLAAISFLLCAFIQLKIEQETPISLQSGHNHVALMNDLNCTFTVESSFFNGTIADHEIVLNVPQSALSDFNANFKIADSQSNSNCLTNQIFNVQTTITNATNENGIIILLSDKIFKHQIDWVSLPNFMVKPDKGGALLFTIFRIDNLSDERFSVTDISDPIHDHFVSKEGTTAFGFLDEFEIEIKGNDISMATGKSSRTYSLDQGATYIQLISGNVNRELNFKLVNIVEKNKLSVFLQVVPYFVITCAEIMFSITGLEFSYSQAPKSMKSVLQAAWLLTVAFGNLIIAIIAELTIFDKQSYEFFFFAGLMAADIALFAVMAYFYVPFKNVDDDENDD